MPNSSFKKPIIIFASGTGTNAEAIIQYFNKNKEAQVCLIVCNKANAKVLDVARNYQIPFLLTDKETFGEALFLEQLTGYKPQLIVLAGFLWKIPSSILETFPNKIVNIHPALLPKYGGKGMYGHKVHQAVKDAGDLETGITIHFVNQNYDEGTILMQAKCAIGQSDSASDIANKVAKLEHAYYPVTIQLLLQKQ
ncbi:MAG: phosphoribosylglycinamide formyltransferase [Chitinophagaceae bacterium]|nr:phosphoribosylglycinamide formyltransferase [Chitinophagaceae bacterium]